MDNLTYTSSGLNIISNVPNESVRFNCKNSSGTTITAINVYNNVAQVHVPISLGSGSNPTSSLHRGFTTSSTITPTSIIANTTTPQIGATFSLNPGTYYLSATMSFTPIADGSMNSVGMQITTSSSDFMFDTNSPWSYGGFLSHIKKTIIANSQIMYSTNVMVSLAMLTDPVNVVYLFNSTSTTDVSGNYYITPL